MAKLSANASSTEAIPSHEHEWVHVVVFSPFLWTIAAAIRITSRQAPPPPSLPAAGCSPFSKSPSVNRHDHVIHTCTSNTQHTRSFYASSHVCARARPTQKRASIKEGSALFAPAAAITPQMCYTHALPRHPILTQAETCPGAWPPSSSTPSPATATPSNRAHHGPHLEHGGQAGDPISSPPKPFLIPQFLTQAIRSSSSDSEKEKKKRREANKQEAPSFLARR